MAFVQKILSLVAGLTVLKTAYAGLDLSSNSNVVVYWGQNSFRGTGNLAQQRLGYYCDDPNIGVIVLAFLTTINGLGGAPEVNFATSSEKCETFPGTNLKNCPEIGEDIPTCQSKGKTILLSIGGATYSEGGFSSATDADAGADLLWATFGPDKGGSSSVHRPFGKAVIDGFDFDFEAAVTNMGEFAKRLRTLADSDTSKKYYLTAAPQCPFPDAADKDILNTEASAAIDAVFVQFYNNFCGVNAFTAARTIKTGRVAAQSNFNFDTWDKWALTESKNKNVRVLLGVPANTGAASTGYLSISSLEPVIAYSKGFESFGGVMMWDVTQAYGNQGFLDGVNSALGKAADQHSPQDEKGPLPSSSPVPKPEPTAEVQLEEEEEEEPASASASPAPTSPPAAPASPRQDQQQQQGPQGQDQLGPAPSATSAEQTQNEVTPQAAAPQGQPLGESTGEQQQNQDQGDDQDRPLNLLPSLGDLGLDLGDDLDWIQI
ncbi:glycoside hydrolase family 18 protein [Aspergillus undulatus]|uniref:glycoside hydrolase family 18 protein n=1 Tax=Aspergillus undulatus TaxID=1810928 RepID=UPI003CCD24AB